MPELAYQDNPGSVPATYTQPTNQTLRPSSVSAEFNGGGAASSFLIALSVYSQDGRLIGRFPAKQVLSPGDSGEVSFGSFLGGDEGGIDYGTNLGDFLQILTTGALGMLLRTLAGDLTLRAAGLIVLIGDVFAEPPTVLDAANFSFRLGDVGTGSLFTIDHVGTGNPLLQADSDTQSVKVNLNDAGAEFDVQDLTGEILAVQGDGAVVVTTDNLFASMRSSSGLFTFADGSSANQLLISGTEGILMPNLPVADPANPGQLWNDAGTLKVS